MILDLVLHDPDGRPAEDGGPLALDSLLARARARGGFCRVDLHEPGPAEVTAVARALGLRPGAVGDAAEEYLRPRLQHDHDDVLVVVLRTVARAADGAVLTGQVAVVLGGDALVTVSRGSAEATEPVRRRLRAPGPLAAPGTVGLLLDACTAVVDGLADVLDALQQDVDDVESSVFSDDRTDDAPGIYALKREVGRVRRAAQPLREPLRRLAAAGPLVPPEAAAGFRAVLDDAVSAAEEVESLDHLLSAAFDAHLSALSVRQNDDMRRISAGAAVVVVPTLIAGVYGMNLHLPGEPGDPAYFWAVLGLMGVVAAALAWVARRAGWL